MSARLAPNLAPATIVAIPAMLALAGAVRLGPESGSQVAAAATSDGPAGTVRRISGSGRADSEALV